MRKDPVQAIAIALAPSERCSASLSIPTDDGALVARIRAGERAAFVEMFTANYTALRDFAVGIAGSIELAEEAVQDVFVRLWELRSTWAVKGTIRAYLFGAVRNRALNARRSRRAGAERAEAWVREGWAVSMGRTRPADAALEAAELQAALARAIDQLPPRCRIVYTLRWRYDLSYAEIAQSLGIAVKTVEAQLAKAMRVLRRELAEYR